MKKFAWVIATVIMLALIGSVVSALFIQRYMNTPIVLPQDTSFLITPGSSLRRVSRDLYDRGIISEPEFFHWYSRLRGKAGAIRAGEYRIQSGVTPAELLSQIVEGKVALHSLTVVEGWTFAQMQKAVRSHPAISPTATGESAVAIMAALGAGDTHPEGQFFPETYQFPRGTTDLAIFRQAHSLMQRKLADAWSRRDEDIPLASPYEALILASIIEKETALASERRQIAGVFARRLQTGMRLQTDPTVIYGIGPDFDGNIRRRDLETDTPYNTYTRSGLPPTPIALPGEGALEAAVRPQTGEALYFVATGLDDGSHYFSATLEEHNAAVKKYLQTLRERKRQP